MKGIHDYSSANYHGPRGYTNREILEDAGKKINEVLRAEYQGKHRILLIGLGGSGAALATATLLSAPKDLAIRIAISQHLVGQAPQDNEKRVFVDDYIYSGYTLGRAIEAFRRIDLAIAIDASGLAKAVTFPIISLVKLY